MEFNNDILAIICFYIGTLRDLSSLACTCRKMSSFIQPKFVLSADGILEDIYPNLKYWRLSGIRSDLTIPPSVVSLDLSRASSIDINTIHGSNLDTLRAMKSMIHYIDTLHMDLLTVLIVEEACLTFIELPPLIRYVDLNNNCIETIVVPEHVDTFIFNDNVLTEISIFAKNIKHMDLSDNYLTELVIPDQAGFLRLDCSNNRWLSALNVPRGVLSVNASKCCLNLLTLHRGIEVLDVSHNSLRGHLDIPDSVTICDISNNFISTMDIHRDCVLNCEYNYHLAQNNAKYVHKNIM